MLLLKRKIFFLNITNTFLHFRIIFYHFKQKLSILLHLSICFLYKFRLISFHLKYFYYLRWNSLSSYILETKLKKVIEFFDDLNFIYYKPKSRYLISIIRSPFVYKKSMEQLNYEIFKIECKTNIFSYNFFLQNYQFKFLKKVLTQNSVLKFFYRLTFFM